MEQEQVALPRIRGRYTCVGVLGQGAMARTYRAVDDETGQIVALKVLYPSRLSSLKEFELFEREARVLSQLGHRNIPTYVDHFPATVLGERTYCIVQAHIDGPSLQTRLDAGERLEEAAVLALAAEVLEVLVYLGSFERPVVHRDIKPSNLVTGPDGRLNLVDFGAVREAVRQTLQCGSTVIGTYGYMPPEQLVGDARPASDVFALGVTLIQCLTRRAASALSTDGFTVQLDKLNLNISTGFRAVLAGMVATRLEDRYGTAAEALEDLRAVQAGRAPRYVDKLTRQRAAREREESAAIRRRLSKGVTWTYRIVAGFAALLFGAAIFLIFTQTAVNLEGGLVAAGVVTALGMMVSLVLLKRRYIDTSWEPPPPTWRTVKGRVVTLSAVEPLGEDAGEAFTRVGYEFHAERPFQKDDWFPEAQQDEEDKKQTRITGVIEGPEVELKADFGVGTKLTIHYEPANAHHHYIEVKS